MKYSMMFMCKDISHPCHNVLADSGAEFSAINSRIVSKHELPVIKPEGPASHIFGASSNMKTKRKGYVMLDISAHYMIASGRQSISFTKQFEVLDLDCEDFIIGADLGPILFPNDDIWKHGAKWAKQMTTWPTNIVRNVLYRPRAAILNAVHESSDEMDEESPDSITFDQLRPHPEKETSDEEEEEEQNSTSSSSFTSSSQPSDSE
jgi:hypothetical protein